MIARFGNRSHAWTVLAALLVSGLGVIALTDAVQGRASEPATKPGAEEAQPAGPAADDVDHARSPLSLIQDRQSLNEQRESLAKQLGAKHPQVKKIDERLRAIDVVLRGGGPIREDQLVMVSVMDLTGPGVETVKTSRVDENGNISLPHAGLIKAAGLRPHEFEQAVARAYQDKGVLQMATVAVSLPARGESHALSRRAVAAMNDELLPTATVGQPGMRSRPQTIDPETAAMLDAKIPDARFDNTALSDVIDFLHDATRANIVVDWRSIEAAGIERSTPITLNLRNVSFKDALTHALRDLGLIYKAENGIVQITIVPAAPQPAKVVVRAYDVADLLRGSDEHGLHGLSDDQVRQNMIGELKQALLLGSNSSGTSITSFGSKVIVSAPESAHRGIEAMLKTLREAPAAPTTAPAKAEQVK
jgi:hypothetical protein